MIAPTPYGEQQRLQALKDLNLLDSPAEPYFDALVASASQLFDVPIALFTLIAERHQVCKAKFGIEIDDLPREHSFCAYAVATDSPLVLEDTHKYRRFAKMPLVTGEPYIRFYAGVPVHAAGGEPIGAICLLDYQPREFPWSCYERLQALAEQIETELRNRKIHPIH